MIVTELALIFLYSRAGSLFTSFSYPVEVIQEVFCEEFPITHFSKVFLSLDSLALVGKLSASHQQNQKQEHGKNATPSKTNPKYVVLKLAEVRVKQKIKQ